MNGFWIDLKNLIKYILLVIMMTLGFFYVYSLIWTALGLAMSIGAIILLVMLAIVSEYGYIHWIMEDFDWE